MIDLRPDHLALVQRILAAHIPDLEVRAFGSRVTRTAKEHSDLDLLVIGPALLPQRTHTRLAMAFEESDLPFRVDIVDWHRTNETFRKMIGDNYEVLQDGRPLGKK